MKKWCAAAFMTLAVMSPAASTASAATEVGNDCPAVTGTSGLTLLQLAKAPGSPLPSTVPTAGVVTKWKVNLEFAPSTAITEKLKVFHATGNLNEFRAVGESAEHILARGINVFETRVPVQAGDQFGLYGPGPASGGIYCAGVPGDVVGGLSGDAAVGSTNEFGPAAGIQVAVSAIIEPDADGDGFGDETQDRCPQSASYQGECPPPIPRVDLQVKAKVRKRAILLRVTPTGQATVDPYGQVGWGFKPNPKLKTAGAKPKRLIVGLSGHKKEVFPGTTTKFRIGLPRLVRERLAKLTPRESVRAKLTLRATNLAGVSKNTRLRVKLKGRKTAG